MLEKIWLQIVCCIYLRVCHTNRKFSFKWDSNFQNVTSLKLYMDNYYISIVSKHYSNYLPQKVVYSRYSPTRVRKALKKIAWTATTTTLSCRNIIRDGLYKNCTEFWLLTCRDNKCLVSRFLFTQKSQFSGANLPLFSNENDVPGRLSVLCQRRLAFVSRPPVATPPWPVCVEPEAAWPKSTARQSLVVDDLRLAEERRQHWSTANSCPRSVADAVRRRLLTEVVAKQRLFTCHASRPRLPHKTSGPRRGES